LKEHGLLPGDTGTGVRKRPASIMGLLSASSTGKVSSPTAEHCDDKEKKEVPEPQVPSTPPCKAAKVKPTEPVVGAADSESEPDVGLDEQAFRFWQHLRG
jgi:hypothetical protein